MRIVSTGYGKTAEFDDPQQWLERIGFYTGILEELAKQHEVFSIDRINYEGEYKQRGVHYFFVWQHKQTVYFPRQMHDLIKKLDPDIVLVNGFIFPLQILQLRWKLGSKARIIVLHRAERPFSGLKRWFQQWADKAVNAYLFSSAEFGKQWIDKGIISDSGKIHEVMQASSSFTPGDQLQARTSIAVNGSLIFLFVGRLDINKDPLTVVKAFIRFLAFQPAAKLYMIYQQDQLLPDIKQLIGSNKNAVKAIQLIGKKPHADLQDWYRAADFIISGSHYEGGGTAVSEAMSCGCIPVLTNIISFRRMLGPGKCGLLYAPGNEEELLMALRQAIELDIEKERARVLEQFREELSFSAIAKKINQVIQKIK